MSKYLVLLDESRLNDSALSDFDRLNTDDSTFHVVVPSRPLSDDERAFIEVEAGPTGAAESMEATAANWRLRDALGVLHERGLDVSGVIGLESPLDSIGSALEHNDYDQVVVVTNPAGLAGWVGLDLASRIDRRVAEPVITIVNADDAGTTDPAATAEPSYLDHEVVDLNDNVIGKVIDVLFDDETGEPQWLVLNTGLLQSDKYVPVEGSYLSSSGNVVVPFDKRLVKEAPKADGDHLITNEVEEELEVHYGVGADN